MGHIAHNAGPNPALYMEADEELDDDEAAMPADGEEENEELIGEGDNDEDMNEEITNKDVQSDASNEAGSDGDDRLDW